MTLDMDKERREFEAEYEKISGFRNAFARDGRGYASVRVQDAWQGWLAAKRSMSTQEAGTAPQTLLRWR